MPNSDKVKRALNPAMQMASSAAYEAFVTGVGPNRELQYSTKEGLTPTGNENAKRNVFSTFALNQDNEVTTRELVQDRIKNADIYAKEAQQIAAAISSKMPNGFEKSSLLGTLALDFPTFIVEGVENYGARQVRNIREIPNIAKDAKNELKLDYLLFNLDKEERENVNEALTKAYNDLLDPTKYPDGVVPSQLEAASGLAMYNVDLLKGKDGQPLSEKEKEIVRTYQETLLASERAKRSQMEEAFFQDYYGQQVAGANMFGLVGDVGLGRTSWRAIGNFAGDALASAYTFKALGHTPYLMGAKGSNIASKFGRDLIASGIKDAKNVQSARGTIKLAETKNRLSLIKPETVRQVQALERYSNYKFGIGQWVCKNFPKVAAFGSMAGKGAVFSQAFLSQFVDTRNELLAAGADWQTANGAALASGFSEGSLETLLGFRFLNKFLTENRSFRNFLFKAMLPEGLEEVSQTAATEIIKAKTGFSDRQFLDIAAEMLYAFVGGAIGGGLFGAGNYGEISTRNRVNIIAEHEQNLRREKKVGEQIQAGKRKPLLELFGKKKEEIRNKYAKLSEEAAKKRSQELKERRKTIMALAKENAVGTDENWVVKGEAEYTRVLEESDKQARAEQEDLTNRMKEELNNAQEQYNAEVEKQQGSFTDLENEILEEMRAEYEERAKKVNPNVTIAQLNNGWNSIKQLLLHDGYTGEFTNAVSTAMDNMISFASAADSQIKKGLDELSNVLGLTSDEQSNAMKLTSTDEIEKYNAQLDLMEEAIVRDFELAGAKEEGDVFAQIFRNQLGSLPAFAMNRNGKKMSPLDFYNAMKPRIINVQNALMHNEDIPNINNIMLEATRQSDTPKAYRNSSGKIDYGSAYEKYLNLWNLIEAYENTSDKDVQKQLLANINLVLFNAYNYTDDVAFIKKYIENRADKEFAIIHDLGLDYGKEFSAEDMRVLALMRQKGLPFAFCARTIGLIPNYAGYGQEGYKLEDAYQKKLDELYPSMTDSDKIWLNRLAKSRETVLKQPISREPKYRDITIDSADNNRAIYGEKVKEESPEEVQAKQDILEEEGELLQDEPSENEDLTKSNSQSETKTTFTAANLNAIDEGHEAVTGETSRYIVPNALYSRNGRTILVINGQQQGEFLHEAGHYMITEFLLNQIELGNIVGDKAYGPINQLLIELYSALRGNNQVRLNPISKQETLLDAIMDFIRTDGHTGNARADAALAKMKSILNKEVLKIDGSRYNELTAEQKANLRTSIKNLFKPTAGMEMLNAVTSLDNLINNKPIDFARQEALKILEQYEIPDADSFRYKLSLKGQDYITQRTVLTEFRNELNLQAISNLLNNTAALENQAKELSQSKSEDENVQEDQVFFMRAEQGAPQREKLAREPLNAKELGENAYEASKGIIKNPMKHLQKYTRPFFASLIDVANRLDSALGPAIQRVMYEHDQLVKRGQDHGKLFMKTLQEQNKTNNPITQQEYDENFADALNNGHIINAKQWLLNRADPKLRSDFDKSFTGMINFLDELKAEMIALGVNANWMEDGMFFPRSIKDYQLFSEEFLRLAPEGVYSKMVSEGLLTGKQGKIKQEEANYSVQRKFAELIRDPGNYEGRVGFLQNRVISEVTTEMRKYYKDPIDAYMDYINDACTTIMTRQLIGAQKNALQIDENGNMNSILNAGVIFTTLDNAGLIFKGRIDVTGLDKSQIEEIREQEERVKEFNMALSSFINRHRDFNGLYKFTNDILTVTMLAHASTALAQGQEMITTAWLFGLMNTAKAAKDVSSGKARITIQDLGIAELEDAYRSMTTGTMQLVADASLKYSGFKLADVYFKNVAINAIYNYFEEALKYPNSEEFKRAKEMIQKSFFSRDTNYQNRVNTLIDDIRNKRLSEDVKYLMYDVFAKQQPINAANISYNYNATSPLGRLCLYKFNTVAYKQCHAIVTRMAENFTKTDKNGKLGIDWSRGLLEVIRFMFFCALIGVPLETVKSLLQGKTDFNPKKDYIFSVAQCFLLNEYDAKILAQDGVGSFLQNKAAAPLTPLNWISQDVFRDLPKGNFTAKSLKGLPVAGRFLHNAIYAIANKENDGIGYDFDFFELDDMDDFSWG